MFVPILKKLDEMSVPILNNLDDEDIELKGGILNNEQLDERYIDELISQKFSQNKLNDLVDIVDKFL